MPAPSALTAPPDHAPLRGQVALVTGGGRGLGAAIASALGGAGMRLVLADVAAQRVQDCAAVLAERDIDAIALPFDVADPAQCADAMDRIVQRFGRLDALVNNAAIDVTAPIGELAVDDWQRILAVNLGGPFVLSRLAAAVMARQRPPGGDGIAGHIVNITSTAAKRAWPNASAYHATKWGLLGLSHALHAELRPQGIRVTAVVAGGMRTPFLTDRFPDIDTGLLQDPAQVAAVVRFVLQQPPGSCVPEVTVLPMRETSWP